jgi:hypothetical protein
MKVSDILKEVAAKPSPQDKLPGETKAQASVRKSKEREAELLASKKATAKPMGSCPPINKDGTWQGD